MLLRLADGTSEIDPDSSSLAQPHAPADIGAIMDWLPSMNVDPKHLPYSLLTNFLTLPPAASATVVGVDTFRYDLGTIEEVPESPDAITPPSSSSSSQFMHSTGLASFLKPPPISFDAFMESFEDVLDSTAGR
eukprot:jgi/Hompol1/4167/HPOL_006958-RA